MLLMKPLNMVDRYKLLDTLLKEASTQRQRDKLLEWMKDQSLELYDVARFACNYGLTSLLVYYRDFQKEDLDYFEWFIRDADIERFPITFDMFRAIYSKLPRKQDAEKMAYVLSKYAYTSGHITDFIIDQFNVSDWIQEFIAKTRDCINILNITVSNDTANRFIHESETSLRNILFREPDMIFKNTAKRNKVNE